MAEVRTNPVPNGPRPAATKAAAAGKPRRTNTMLLNLLIIAVCMIISHLFFHIILGNASNFNDAERHSPKNLAGTVYLGGFVVPILLGTFLVVIAFIIERALTITRARGKMNAGEFVRKVQYHLANKNVDAAIAECDKQSGSVGNVMKAGLIKYKEMTTNTELSTDQKVLSIQKEVEEATALELPMLERNLVFLSTITSAATLLGLIGTVLGMIRSFQAMGQAGAPDAAALANGISEALINTAIGISTSLVAMIAYNFFTTTIDGITFGIDESGFTLTQSFAANYR